MEIIRKLNSIEERKNYTVKKKEGNIFKVSRAT